MRQDVFETEFDRGFLAATDNTADTVAIAHRRWVTAEDRNRELKAYNRHLRAHNLRLRQIVAFQALVIALFVVCAVAWLCFRSYP